MQCNAMQCKAGQVVSYGPRSKEEGGGAADRGGRGRVKGDDTPQNRRSGQKKEPWHGAVSHARITRGHRQTLPRSVCLVASAAVYAVGCRITVSLPLSLTGVVASRTSTKQPAARHGRRLPINARGAYVHPCIDMSRGGGTSCDSPRRCCTWNVHVQCVSGSTPRNARLPQPAPASSRIVPVKS
jgi:hypothetical protein